jgi:hypothetical protein
MFIDVCDFWPNDNRENLVQEKEEPREDDIHLLYANMQSALY